ncbi:MAG: helix-turn-helix transcriptional regulator [bacterium]
MLQLAHFLLFFVFAIGLVVIFVAVQLYKKYRLKYLLSNVYMLAGFNLLSFSNAVETFIKLTVPEKYFPFVFDRFSTVALFVLPLIIIFSTYHFIIVIYGLINKPLSSYIKITAIGLSVLFIIIQIIYFIAPGSLPNTQYYSLIFINMLFFLVTGFSVTRIFPFAFQIKHKERKRALTLFAGTVLFFILTMLFLTVGALNSWISGDVQIAVLNISILIFNPAIVIFFKRYHQNYISIESPGIEELIDKYKISKRERDIIQLVSKGKSNKEIAAELFITAVTVRDHLSNIYRKTNVKTRLQLSNLFQQAGGLDYSQSE